jgi:hypothetical protein
MRIALMSGRGGGRAGSVAAKEEGPKPFDPLMDFDPKQARKAAMDQAIEEGKGSDKPQSQEAIAKRAQGIYSSLRSAASSENTSMHVQSTIGAAFRKAGKDAGAYAGTYEQAQQLATPQQLTAWGFSPPGASGGAKPSKPSSGGGQPVASASAAQLPAATPIAMAATPAPAQAPRALNTIEQIEARKVSALAPLAQQVKQADLMFTAAAKSGDQRAIAGYMQQKQQLRAELEKQANDQFGNQAAGVLAKLYAN